MNASKILEDDHPYPTDIFPQPGAEEIARVIKLLQAVEINETRIFAHFARIGYNAAIRRLEPKTVGDIK